MIKGIGAAEGYTLAKAKNVNGMEEAYSHTISAAEVDEELEKLNCALEHVILNIQASYQNAADTLGEEVAEIFAVHQMLLEDESFLQPIQERIKQLHSAADAVDTCCKEVSERFAAMDDEYLKERAADFLDLRKQLLRSLNGETGEKTDADDHSVLIGQEVLPSDLLGNGNVAGIVMAKCGRASHVVILARSLGIPAVVGVQEADIKNIPDGDMLLVDGREGTVCVNPSQMEQEEYASKVEALAERAKVLQQYKRRPSETLDGVHIDICANITSVPEARCAMENGADGIGLMRTEFLYMNRPDLPSEQEQYECYAKVLAALEGKPVIVRTLDIGADKKAESLHLPEEENPAMGYRAIRICLDRKELFLQQIRALLKASVKGSLWIMLPMISGLEELAAAKDLIEQAKKQLLAQGCEVAENIPVGIMIEVPSAAVAAESLAQNADFFSIGTNDLTQYTLAVDRNNASVAMLYQTMHPAVLHLIARASAAAARNGIPCGMCGETAGDSRLTPLWIGMGLTELSVSIPGILQQKAAMSKISKTECQELWNSVSGLCTTAAVEEALQRFTAGRQP